MGDPAEADRSRSGSCTPKSGASQLYWSDTHQLAEYLDNYHEKLDQRLAPAGRGTEMISEVYVPRRSLFDFMNDPEERFQSDWYRFHKRMFADALPAT